MTFASGVLDPVQDHAASYLPGDDVVAVVGGRSSSDAQAPSTKWQALDLAASEVTSFNATDRLYGATAAFDARQPRMLVFGGWRGTSRPSGDLWQIDLSGGFAARSSDVLRPSGDKPVGRFGHAAAFDPVRRRLVVYGGASAAGQLVRESSTWVWDAAPGAWSELGGAWIGERFGAVMVFDDFHGTVLLAGGTSGGSRDAKGDVFYLDCPGVVTPTAGPTDTASPAPATDTFTATASSTPTIEPTWTASPSAMATTTAGSPSGTPTRSATPPPVTTGPPSPAPSPSWTAATGERAYQCWAPIAMSGR